MTPTREEVVRLLTASVPGKAVEALQFDESTLWPSDLTYAFRRHGRGYIYTITASPETWKKIAIEATDRAQMSGGEGFDDPPSWRAACRELAHRADAILAAGVEE